MNESVMIVDDEQQILNSCRRILVSEEFDCHFFQSPVEALNSISRINPAVILSDQRMGEMQGVELLSKIRKIQPACVRILMTGYTDIESTIKAINQGHIYRYIRKPWSDTHFLTELRNALVYYKFKSRSIAALAQNVPSHMLAVQEQERLLGVREMAAAICHEFAQPLQVISGYSGILNEVPGAIENKADVKEYLPIIHSQVERLGDLLLKVMTVKYYKTKPYSSNKQMVDLDKAACIEDLQYDDLAKHPLHQRSKNGRR